MVAKRQCDCVGYGSQGRKRIHVLAVSFDWCPDYACFVSDLTSLYSDSLFVGALYSQFSYSRFHTDTEGVSRVAAFF